MAELGYGGSELYKKGRFRPATFWRPSAVTLVSATHRDRTLITAFALTPTAPGSAEPPPVLSADVTIINCHLQAGPEGARRLRQMHDAVETAVKAAKRTSAVDPAQLALVVCGDLNGDERAAAVRLLEDGVVHPSFLEDGEPTTSKPKKLPLPPLVDCAAAVSSRPPPPTLVVAELISALLEGKVDAGRSAKLSAGAETALRAAFNELSCGKPAMDRADVERWLLRTNLQLGRGSEFRAARAEMCGTDLQVAPAAAADGAPAASGADGGGDDDGADGAVAGAALELPADGVLSCEAFLRIYEAELRAGKFWGVAYDMHALGHPPPTPEVPVFSARYDRVYASQALEVVAVRDCTSSEPCPNRVHPSDHLPVGVSLRLRDPVTT